MKKCGIFAIAALMTILCGRLNATVESDIVGYTTITMDAGKWYMIGCPFASLDGAQTVNNTFDNGFASGDVMMSYNSDSGKYENTCYWVDGKGWCDNPIFVVATVVNYPLTGGQAVLIKKGATSTCATISGKVEAAPVTFGLDEGQSWAQFTIGYPIEVELNDLTWTNMATGDVAMIYNPDTGVYENTCYWVEGKGWCDNPVIATPKSVKVGVSQAIVVNKKSTLKGKVEVK